MTRRATEGPGGPVDWTGIGRELGFIHTQGGRGGTAVAQATLIALLGDAAILSAVQAYVDREPGSEVARSVLVLLEPPRAMKECWRIYRTSSDTEVRRFAIQLLGSFCDERALPWLEEIFTTSSDDETRVWACMGIGHLAERDCIDPEVIETYIDRIARDDEWYVAATAEHIRSLHALEDPATPLERRIYERLSSVVGLDDARLAFLVAHLLTRAPQTEARALARRLERWCEQNRQFVDPLALFSLAETLVVLR